MFLSSLSPNANRAEMAVAFGRGCGFASGRLLGATGPRMESYNWKAKPISPCLGPHEAHPKTTLFGVVFQKLNGPLLTSDRNRRLGRKRRCDNGDVVADQIGTHLRQTIIVPVGAALSAALYFDHSACARDTSRPPNFAFHL